MSAAPGKEASGFTIRPAKSLQEVSQLWWPLMKDLGWNRDHDDAPAHYKAASNGKDWLMLAPKESEKPEGCVAAFIYPNSTGWLAFFCINAPFRGKGMGGPLFKACLDQFDASDTEYVGLDGVEEQVNMYRRRGFEVAANINLMTRPSLQEKPSTIDRVSKKAEEHIVDLKAVDPELLMQVDLAHTGLHRAAYWSQEGLLARKDAYGYALVSKDQGDEKIAGFILVRRCQHGHRFGPLYAETYQQALLLLHTAMENISQNEGSMIAEIFASNPNGRKVFEELGWTWTGMDYYRMWLGGRVPKAQQAGERGTSGMFAIFDAASG